MKGFFVTGTDTGVGKTHISLALMRLLQQRGLRVIGYKPVASGAVMTAHGLRNEDGLALMQQSNVPIEYADINPFCFADAIAPHLAARAANEIIDDQQLVAQYHRLATRCDAVIVEGAGGWRVPLNEHADIASLAQHIGLPVVLVVAIRLGCLNHALLTADAIRSQGVALAGWIANRVDLHDKNASAMIESLRERIAAPCFGAVPESHDPLGVLDFLHISM